MKIPQYLPEAFAKVVDGLRKERGMTKIELAQRSGIQESYLRAITYRKRNPSISVAWSIAEGLGVPVWEILKRTEEYRKHLLKDENVGSESEEDAEE